MWMITVQKCCIDSLLADTLSFISHVTSVTFPIQTNSIHFECHVISVTFWNSSASTFFKLLWNRSQSTWFRLNWCHPTESISWIRWFCCWFSNVFQNPLEHGRGFGIIFEIGIWLTNSSIWFQLGFDEFVISFLMCSRRFWNKDEALDSYLKLELG